MPPPVVALSPRIFRGGLGEAPELLSTTQDENAQPILEKEHRYWFVLRYVASTTKCTLVPLLACGRFGGCGRRAGRVRWKPAPLKQGYEREVLAPTLQLVTAESINSAREQDSNAWVIDDQDAEHAAREQAAAARNKKRRLSVEDTQALVNAVGGWPALAPRAPREGVSRKRVACEGGSKPVPVRKKKRLAPASRSCLACTKGKHSAHTCGVRGKAVMEALKVQQAGDCQFLTPANDGGEPNEGCGGQ